jgi:antitoxin component YwqK of YwqJK toxin-antitoxin module
MRFLPFFIFLTFHLSAQNWIDINQTIQIDDTIYSKTTGLPYSGLITKTADNGQITFKARAIKGLYNGKFVRFFSNGDTLQKGEYKKGKLHGNIYEYNRRNLESGIKPYCWAKTQLINGIKSGKSESYFENGKVYISSLYINDKQTGQCTIYKETGKVYAKGMLFLGEAEGDWYVYNQNDEPDDVPFAVLVFENGKLSNCYGNCAGFSIGYDSFDTLLLDVFEIK